MRSCGKNLVEKTKTVKSKKLLTSLLNPVVVEELIVLYLDYFMSQPIKTTVKTSDLTTAIVAGLRGAANDPQNETWLVQLIVDGIKQVRKQKNSGTVKDVFPPKAMEACMELAQVPISVSKETAMALIDHAVVKAFLREILTQSILEFSQQLAAYLPGGKVMTGLMGMARDIASSRLGGVGINLEQKAKTFVEEALSPSIKVVAELLADKNQAAGLADWRRHIVGVVVNLSRREFVGVFENVSEKKLAKELAVLFKSVALWEKLEPTIKAYLDEAMKQVGDRSIRSLIEGTSLEKEWRSLLSHQLASVLHPFFAGPEFKTWLEKYG
jgi:hypothetical protein